MKHFAVYSILKYLQRTVKKIIAKNAPTQIFLTWGVSDLNFSQFLKTTFNNSVNKFAKICENA